MRKFFLFFFLLFFFLPLKAYAANFSTDYTVNYTVNNSSKTHVSFDVTLTNTTEQYYASSYTIHVGFDDVENITASDPDGSIVPKITDTSKGKTIELEFNKKVVGLGNKLTFNLRFDTDEVASAIGNVWAINVPGLSNQSEFSSFNVNVIYPTFLGRPVSIKPDNSNLINRAQGNRISFSKSDLGTSGISIAFGNFQIYSFDLTYHLENKNLFPVITEIAIPPQTNYQDISISEISPKPRNVTVDTDGNWLAQYNLSPSQDLKVIVSGKAKVYLSPKDEKINEKDLSLYLRERKYWEVNNPKIKNLALELKTPKRIYQYIVDNLTYDFSRVTSNKPRAGALNVLNDPTSAVCLEFTDIFVGLARAAGIPAREVDGYANTKNTQERPLSLVKDVLHAWPEYYDSERQMWIMIDPTWGNTTNGIDYFDTLDFDHFAFVKKGKDSNYPVPAGGYKTEKDLTTKDVDVKLSSDFSGEYLLLSEPVLSKEFLPGLPIRGKVVVRNQGSVISKPKILKIESSFLKPLQKEIAISEIPPYGYVEVPIGFEKTELLTNKKDIVTISVDKNLHQQAILISPLALGWQIIGGVLSVIAIVISIIIFRSGRIPLFWKK